VRSVVSGQVIVLRNGHRKKIPIRIGAIDGEMAEIISGDVKPDDRVLLKGK
jgi:hypothetical protein